jgi:peptide/nickel transport system substrate-binding protein
MQKRTFLGLSVALLTGAAMPARAQASGKVLRTVPLSDLKILDPIWTTAVVTRNHAFMIYDTLFGVDEKGRPQPQMVDTFRSNADLTVWDFTLRSGLVFHDGSPVTSDDVIASVRRWAKRDPFGQRMFASVTAFEAVDNKSFRMTFGEAFGLVPEALGKASTPVPFIMPKRVADTPADQQIADTTGSGPFIFKKDEYRPGERVVYVRNPQYKARTEAASGTAGGKQVYLDRVEWIIFKDSQTKINALVNGEVDMLEASPEVAALRPNQQIELLELVPPYLSMVYYNHLVPPFNDPKIARAAMLAINQEAMLRGQMVEPDLYRPCTSIFQCGSLYASDKTGGFTGKPQFEKAKALLKDAGYNGAPVVVLAPTDLPGLDTFPVIYAQLLKLAGFNVDLQAMDWAALTTRRVKKVPANMGGWNVFISQWNASDAANPAMYGPLTGSGEKGYIGWPTDAQLEALKGNFLTAKSEAERKRIAEEMQVRAYDAAIFGPIGENRVFSAVRKGVVGGLLRGPAVVYWNVKKS